MNQECSVCLKPKAHLACGVCLEALCKNCDQFLEPDYFSFWEKIPSDLTLIHYCPSCFEQKVSPAQASYEAIMEKARDVYIIFIAQRVIPSLLKKGKKTIEIRDCKDRDETILRLGFRAAEQGYNAVINVDLKQKQIRNLAYQTSLWSGTGLPAQIDGTRYERDES